MLENAHLLGDDHYREIYQSVLWSEISTGFTALLMEMMEVYEQTVYEP